MNNGRIVRISVILHKFLISTNLHSNFSNCVIHENFGGFQRKIDHSCFATSYSHDPLHQHFNFTFDSQFWGISAKN